MASSPLGPNATIDVCLNDDADPEGGMIVALYPDNGGDHQELFWSLPGQDWSYFWWAVDSIAARHEIDVHLALGVERKR